MRDVLELGLTGERKWIVGNILGVGQLEGDNEEEEEWDWIIKDEVNRV